MIITIVVGLAGLVLGYLFGKGIVLASLSTEIAHLESAARVEEQAIVAHIKTFIASL